MQISNHSLDNMLKKESIKKNCSSKFYQNLHPKQCVAVKVQNMLSSSMQNQMSSSAHSFNDNTKHVILTGKKVPSATLPIVFWINFKSVKRIHPKHTHTRSPKTKENILPFTSRIAWICLMLNSIFILFYAILFHLSFSSSSSPFALSTSPNNFIQNYKLGHDIYSISML